MKALFKFSGLLAFVALLIASCIQEPVVEEPAVCSIHVTVGAGIVSNPGTKSEVAIDEDGARVLKFTEGDRLYIWKTVSGNSNVAYVAGFLTMVGSPSADGKSASFTGTLQAYNKKGSLQSYNFGSNPLEGTTATLVHAGLIEGTDYNFILADPEWGKINLNHFLGYDVEEFMTRGLTVTGNYDSETHCYALCSGPIFHCYISGLTPETTYAFILYYYTTGTGLHVVSQHMIFTTDENGIGKFTFASPESGEHHWFIRIFKSGTTIGDIDFGTINLTTKIYNIQRWWNGSAFCAPTNMTSINENYTARNGEILTGTLASNCKLQVPDGYTVLLAGMTHHAGQYVSGIECQGSATINLVDGTTNDLTPDHQNAYGGIIALAGTLTIDGTGTLLAEGSYGFAGIGSLNQNVNIVIDGGNITATGGTNAAGIGANYQGSVGNITINGGNVTVTGGGNAAGIGCGVTTGGGSCGDITFNDGTVVVNASSSGWGVGLGNTSQTCGNIKFNGGSVTIKGMIRTSANKNKKIYINNEP